MSKSTTPPSEHPYHGNLAQLSLTDIISSDDYDLGPVGQWVHHEPLRHSPFFTEALTRLVVGRDMNVIITASSETGVGKTTLAVVVAILLDQHGWTADKASVADPADYDYRYDRVQPGSCLILDEAEKAMDARRGMSNDSVNLSQTFATKRYRQVFSILTAPSKSWIDKRLGSDAADYWIQAQSTDDGRITGNSKVYRLRSNEHYERDYTERTEYLSWPPIDELPEFQKLDQRKRDLLEGDTEQQYVDANEVETIKQNAADEARKEQRKAMMQQLSEQTELTHSDIGAVYDLSQARVTQIIND